MSRELKTPKKKPKGGEENSENDGNEITTEETVVGRRSVLEN